MARRSTASTCSAPRLHLQTPRSSSSAAFVVVVHPPSISGRYAFKNCPVAEYINLSHKADTIVPYFGGLFSDEPLPSGGFIDLPERPGFGVTLVKEGLVRPYPRSPEHSAAQAKANIEYPPPTKPVFSL